MFYNLSVYQSISCLRPHVHLHHCLCEQRMSNEIMKKKPPNRTISLCFLLSHIIILYYLILFYYFIYLSFITSTSNIYFIFHCQLSTSASTRLPSSHHPIIPSSFTSHLYYSQSPISTPSPPLPPFGRAFLFQYKWLISPCLFYRICFKATYTNISYQQGIVKIISNQLSLILSESYNIISLS